MSDDLLDEMKEFVQRNEGRATIKIVASPRQPKTRPGGGVIRIVATPKSLMGSLLGELSDNAIRFIESMNALEKEEKNMDNEIRVEDMVEVPGNRRGKVLEINNTAVIDVQVPGGANEIWPIEKLRKIPTQDGVLKAKPVMVQGEEWFEITGWDKVLREEELPKAYTEEGYPVFCSYPGRDGPVISLQSEKRIIGAGGSEFGLNPKKYAYKIEVGDLYTPEAFGGLLDELKKAGARLKEINRDIKRREARWVGPEKEYPI